MTGCVVFCVIIAFITMDLFCKHQVFEMERPDGSWVFTFYTLALEVRGADKLNVMLVNQASGDVITTLQV